MTKLAIEYEAINLSQGFPDFNCDPLLIEIVRRNMLEGHNQYAPMPGLFRLREQLSGKMHSLYNAKVDPDKEITITSGATQGLFTALSTFILQRDEVIIFEPAYDSYKPVIEAMGGHVVPVSLKPPSFQIDWDKFESSISNLTKMVIINTPHNPCGIKIPAEDIKRLTEYSEKHGFLILSDEVYEHIVFDGKKHNSLLAHYADCPNIITVFSFGKTYHTTGWKVGYVVANQKLTEKFRKMHQFTVFAVNTPVQYAYAEFLEDKSRYLSLPAFYQQKRDYFLQLLQGSPFIARPAEGTYFQLLDYRHISSMRDIAFAEMLVKEFKIAVIPLSPFYTDGSSHTLIRICFAKKEETLKAGAERLLEAANKFGGF
jgi:methionine aminotransferase